MVRIIRVTWKKPYGYVEMAGQGTGVDRTNRNKGNTVGTSEVTEKRVKRTYSLKLKENSLTNN
jgi:hypothetical protein